MEYKIGEIITIPYSGTVMVEEADNNCHCSGCAFVICAPLCHAVKCRKECRFDGKNVIFKEIK